MYENFSSLNPIFQALLAGLFTWFVTAVGAASVFLSRRVSRRLLDGMLGFSGGVMLAASYWSLLGPAIEISSHGALPAWFPPAVGFLAGGAVLWLLDKSLPHLHLGFPVEEAEGPKTTWRRSILLVSAITLHNIPEGLAVGVAFGGVIEGVPSASTAAAIALAIGIGIQNFPEGIAVAMPLRAEGMGQLKSFWFGQLSALVEPIAAMAGAALVVVAAPLLPYALSFAAGAMIYVVVEELIPEAERAGNVDLATVTLMIGFTTMMILDVALG
ncbi:ZIP family metal transporter [Bythopirellula polymerisocia]|uniref:Zinc transporter ZupT n=1 Tax=Bythopirellula polymerisocia TaxID=2528003 RepID=A0A5C6CG67_9BACT|nr:ZIP family metal transporter [Bythopirellula polymerisocia]TWU23640.1 Zinc transporter ZupT [Bythopirellula polymerisocia]